LAERFATFRRAGATWNWPDYQPHVTLAYDLRDAEAANAALAAVVYAGPLLFGGEQFAPVKV
jgi:2'-5' RNA ligase